MTKKKMDTSKTLLIISPKLNYNVGRHVNFANVVLFTKTSTVSEETNLKFLGHFSRYLQIPSEASENVCEMFFQFDRTLHLCVTNTLSFECEFQFKVIKDRLIPE